MAKIIYSNRVSDLVAIFGSQTKTAKALGVSQSYISRLMKGSRGKKLPNSLKQKISNRWNYRRKKYAYQPRAKVKVDSYDYPIWVSGNVVELDNLQLAKDMLLEDLQERYEYTKILFLRVRRFDLN